MPAATPLWYVDVRSNTLVVRSTDTARTETFLRQSGIDRALIRVEEVRAVPRPLADLRGGDAYYIDGAARCSIGFPVTQGGQPGFVEELNATVNYQEGSVYGLTRTSVCAEPGDSGGSFVSGDQAQGVTSGGSGDCTSGGETYFQPVNPILGTYGLTLATG